MVQILHSSATTMHAVQAAIQRSRARSKNGARHGLSFRAHHADAGEAQSNPVHLRRPPQPIPTASVSRAPTMNHSALVPEVIATPRLGQPLPEDRNSIKPASPALAKNFSPVLEKPANARTMVAPNPPRGPAGHAGRCL